MDRLNRLLKEVSEILLKEKTQQQERRKRGECFNIFEVLGLQTSEVRLHSAILAELLNPYGDHGLGDRFLKAFIQDVVSKNCEFTMDTTSTKVYTEFSIGNISEDYTEGGRIDLLIQDKSKRTIIIENKIYAGDQPYQLLRYNNYARKELSDNKYTILYLTLHDGEQPSQDSIGKDPFEYFCISYKSDILTWLEHCLEIAVRHPLVRETIQQYINNLNNILSIMNTENMEKYIQILTSEENIETTISIIKNTEEIAVKIREKFVEQLKEKCEQSLGYCCEYDKDIIYWRKGDQNKWIRVFDKSIKDVVFMMGFEDITKTNGGVCMYIWSPGNQKVEKKYNFDIWPDFAEPTPEMPTGWCYLWSETGKGRSGEWWNWNNWDTLRDIANGKMLSFVLERLRKIKEQDVFRQISLNLEESSQKA